MSALYYLNTDDVSIAMTLAGVKPKTASLVLDLLEDDEQLDRIRRGDLCNDCVLVGHDTCSLDANCACCRTTIAAMQEQGDFDG